MYVCLYISVGGSHGNGAVEESQPSHQPTSVTQLASHMSVDGCVSNHVEIVVTDTASASKKNSVEEEETTSVSEVLQLRTYNTPLTTYSNCTIIISDCILSSYHILYVLVCKLYVLFPIYVAVTTHRQVYIPITMNVFFFSISDYSSRCS